MKKEISAVKELMCSEGDPRSKGVQFTIIFQLVTDLLFLPNSEYLRTASLSNPCEFLYA